MDKEAIINKFVRNFIVKNRRERSLFELTHTEKRDFFAGRFNHGWAGFLDMKKIILIPKKCNQYNFVKENLHIEDGDLCYLISCYSDIDDQVMSLKEAFEKSGRGFATLIIIHGGDKIYLKTEQVQGSPESFIGKL